MYAQEQCIGERNDVVRERNCDKKEIMILYSGHKRNKREFGTKLYIDR